MQSSCPPCTQHCHQGRQCPATIAMRQKPVGLPLELRKLVERLTGATSSGRPLA